MPEATDRPAWPWFLAPMRDGFEGFRPPSGSFDPSGSWEHTYTVFVLQPERKAKAENPNKFGKLTVRRKPAGAGKFQLEVEESLMTRARSEMKTRATITCAVDRLATPRAWQLHARGRRGGSGKRRVARGEHRALRPDDAQGGGYRAGDQQLVAAGGRAAAAVRWRRAAPLRHARRSGPVQGRAVAAGGGDRGGGTRRQYDAPARVPADRATGSCRRTTGWTTNTG